MAASRKTTNSKPSAETSVMYLLGATASMVMAWLRVHASGHAKRLYTLRKRKALCVQSRFKAPVNDNSSTCSGSWHPVKTTLITQEVAGDSCFVGNLGWCKLWVPPT
jgi:hypothetical protein